MSANRAAISCGDLEIMLGRQPAAVVGGQHFAFGDADQRVMGGIVVGPREIGLVGGDQRQVKLVGEIDQRVLGELLILAAVALQFDIEPIAEKCLKLQRGAGARAAAVAGRSASLSGPSGPPVRQIRPSACSLSMSMPTCGSALSGVSR